MKKSSSTLLPAIALAGVLTACGSTHADWRLDGPASRVDFVTTKAGSAAEMHSFADVSGQIAADGDVTIGIELDSLDTGIEIRDTRMRELLFETGTFPQAVIEARVDAEAIAALAVGERTTADLEAMVSLHGAEVPLMIDATVVRLTGDRLLVNSRRPLIVQAAQFDLVAGVEALREVAGLPSISPAVVVTFQLEFVAD